MKKINWQKPYVNTFKHFTIASDKNAVKHGDITTTMVIMHLNQSKPFKSHLKGLRKIEGLNMVKERGEKK